MYADEAKSAAVLFALGLKIEGDRTEVLKLRGLDPEAMYSLKEINCGKRLHASFEADCVKGRDLMEKGVSVRLSGDYDSAVFEIRKK